MTPLSMKHLDDLVEWAKGSYPAQCRTSLYVLASWFLLRASEVVALLCQDLVVDEIKREVSVHIRTSKTDIEAAGSRRSHGCACQGDEATRELEAARPQDQLVVERSGQPMTKRKLLEDLRSDLGESGAITSEEELRPECFGTHSFRRGGTQFLIRFISWEKVQTFGRWRSPNSMKRYVEEANLADSSQFAKRVVKGWFQQPAGSTSSQEQKADSMYKGGVGVSLGGYQVEPEPEVPATSVRTWQGMGEDLSVRR
ncbi:hypothetical protein FOL46_000805 [Perkinsus olseni]|uniref:Tyr recombinase domain-containing protein n=1 Tax=Perkinsus olseni TaxID=32597 RepID=A0A7J6MVS5_PEROL|nr:hypothetical protein FOL46_000805 [Perkinsus olseni]